jgi:hypothetical protein
MAPYQAHLDQARHNTELAQYLAQDMVYKDWVITAAFYAAVHYVEAAFAKRGWHGDQTGGESPHIWRLNQLRQRKEYPTDCWKAYKSLYESSRKVRYLLLWQETSSVANSYYSDDDVRQFLTEDLQTIQNSLGL